MTEVLLQNQRHKSTIKLLGMNILASFGALYWGYYQCHYNVTSDIYTIMMGINAKDVSTFNGLVTGMIQFGGIFGALISSQLVNKIARRKAFLIIDTLSILGTLLHCIKNIPCLLIGNFIGGFSMGLNSTFIGCYISEVSPREVSGMMGTLLQYMISLGIILTSILGIFMPTTQQYIDNNKSNQFWLFIFIFPILFPLIRMIYFLFLQKLDTPYYYSKNELKAELEESLFQIYHSSYIDEMTEEINQFNSKQEQDQSIMTILQDKLLRHKLQIGLGLAFIMQISGINAVMFYSNTIFKEGKTDQKSEKLAQTLTLINNIFMMISSAIAGYFVDKLGRKQILLAGQILLSMALIALVILGYADILPPQKYIVILFTFTFGVSLGPVIWLYIPEILNGKSISLSAFSVWVFATIIGFATPIAFDSSLKQFGTFAIFAAFSTLFILWEFFYLVESKNKTKQQIEQIFINKLKLDQYE